MTYYRNTLWFSCVHKANPHGWKSFCQPTNLQRVFDSSDPVQLLSPLELIWTPIGQAGIQPAVVRGKAREGKRKGEHVKRRTERRAMNETRVLQQLVYTRAHHHVLTQNMSANWIILEVNLIQSRYESGISSPDVLLIFGETPIGNA